MSIQSKKLWNEAYRYYFKRFYCQNIEKKKKKKLDQMDMYITILILITL